MRAVIQRVSRASVTIEDQVHSNIAGGFLILLGITDSDQMADVEWLVRKIAQLRVFGDHEGLMNRSVCEVKGSILVVSQFTLYASTKKGNRPSFLEAASPEIAFPIYSAFINKLQNATKLVIEQGVFGAEMQVELCNDGPVTIIIDTKKKE